MFRINIVTHVNINAAYGGTISGISYLFPVLLRGTSKRWKTDGKGQGMPIGQGRGCLSNVNHRNIVLIVIVEVLACHTPDEGVVVGAGCCVH